ncbi:EAL and HDOD domain-containing protein [Leptothrix sp. BB-3]
MHTRPFEADAHDASTAWATGMRRPLVPSGTPLSRSQPAAWRPEAGGPTAAPAVQARCVGLQVIADMQGMALGYELLYRPAGGAAAGTITDDLLATCEVLATAVLDLGLPRKTDGLSFFVNVDQQVLMSPIVEAITPGWGIVELLESVVASPAVVRRVRELRQRGMRFALDDIETLDDSRWALIADVEVVKIDWQRARRDELAQMMALARRHGVRLLAEKVERASDLEMARAMGFDLAQGYAVAVPDVIQAPGLPACMPLVLRRTRLLLQHGASCESLATALASDPATVMRIGQLVEQEGVRARSSVRPARLSELAGDVPRAVLQAWLMVLEAVDAGPVDRAWTYTGLVQARLMKVLARRVAPQDLALADEAFMLGLRHHVSTTLGIQHRDADASVRGGLLGSLLEFSRSQFRQPAGWLPGPLAIYPGLSQALPSIYREAHLWARERSQSGAPVNGGSSAGQPVGSPGFTRGQGDLPHGSAGDRPLGFRSADSGSMNTWTFRQSRRR